MTLNDLELCEQQKILREKCKGLDEMIAQGRSGELEEIYGAIAAAASAAKARLKRIRDSA